MENLKINFQIKEKNNEFPYNDIGSFLSFLEFYATAEQYKEYNKYILNIEFDEKITISIYKNEDFHDLVINIVEEENNTDTLLIEYHKNDELLLILNFLQPMLENYFKDIKGNIEFDDELENSELTYLLNQLNEVKINALEKININNKWNRVNESVVKYIKENIDKIITYLLQNYKELNSNEVSKIIKNNLLNLDNQNIILKQEDLPYDFPAYIEEILDENNQNDLSNNIEELVKVIIDKILVNNLKFHKEVIAEKLKKLGFKKVDTYLGIEIYEDKSDNKIFLKNGEFYDDDCDLKKYKQLQKANIIINNSTIKTIKENLDNKYKYKELLKNKLSLDSLNAIYEENYTYNGKKIPNKVNIDKIEGAYINPTEEYKVEKYFKVMIETFENGEDFPFPPVSGYPDTESDKFILVDGFHRVEALRKVAELYPYDAGDINVTLAYESITNEKELEKYDKLDALKEYIENFDDIEKWIDNIDENILNEIFKNYNLDSNKMLKLNDIVNLLKNMEHEFYISQSQNDLDDIGR